MLTPLLTSDTADVVIAKAVRKSIREIEVLVAKMSGAPAQRVRVQVKILGVPKVVHALPSLFQVSLPVDNSDIDVKNAKKDEPREVTYHVTLLLDEEGYQFLQVLHATKSDKSASKIVTSLMKQEVEKGQKRLPKKNTVPAPPKKVEKAQSRVIPDLVKRVVWARDQGQCIFIGDGGRRCTCRTSLQVHHVFPFAKEGTHSVDIPVLVEFFRERTPRKNSTRTGMCCPSYVEGVRNLLTYRREKYTTPLTL